VHGHAGVAVGAELEHRDDVGVLQRELDQSVVTDRVGLDPVLGKAGQLLRAELDGRAVVADVALEGLPELGGPLVDGPDAVACLGVTVDAGAPEVAQREVRTRSPSSSSPEVRSSASSTTIRS
jgi:hypothetical protein